MGCGESKYFNCALCDGLGNLMKECEKCNGQGIIFNQYCTCINGYYQIECDCVEDYVEICSSNHLKMSDKITNSNCQICLGVGHYNQKCDVIGCNNGQIIRRCNLCIDGYNEINCHNCFGTGKYSKKN